MQQVLQRFQHVENTFQLTEQHDIALKLLEHRIETLQISIEDLARDCKGRLFAGADAFDDNVLSAMGEPGLDITLRSPERGPFLSSRPAEAVLEQQLDLSSRMLALEEKLRSEMRDLSSRIGSCATKLDMVAGNLKSDGASMQGRLPTRSLNLSSLSLSSRISALEMDMKNMMEARLKDSEVKTTPNVGQRTLDFELGPCKYGPPRIRPGSNPIMRSQSLPPPGAFAGPPPALLSSSSQRQLQKYNPLCTWPNLSPKLRSRDIGPVNSWGSGTPLQPPAVLMSARTSTRSLLPKGGLTRASSLPTRLRIVPSSPSSPVPRSPRRSLRSNLAATLGLPLQSASNTPANLFTRDILGGINTTPSIPLSREILADKADYKRPHMPHLLLPQLLAGPPNKSPRHSVRHTAEVEVNWSPRMRAPAVAHQAQPPSLWDPASSEHSLQPTPREAISLQPTPQQTWRTEFGDSGQVQPKPSPVQSPRPIQPRAQEKTVSQSTREGYVKVQPSQAGLNRSSWKLVPDKGLVQQQPARSPASGLKAPLGGSPRSSFKQVPVAVPAVASPRGGHQRRNVVRK